MWYTWSFIVGWEPVQIILNWKPKLIIFDQESLLHVLPVSLIGSTTFLFKTPLLAKCLGRFEFKTLLTLSGAFCKIRIFFCTRPSDCSYVQIWHKQEFWTREILLSAKFCCWKNCPLTITLLLCKLMDTHQTCSTPIASPKRKMFVQGHH